MTIDEASGSSAHAEIDPTPIRVIHALLGHSKVESSEVEDAIEVAEKIDI